MKQCSQERWGRPTDTLVAALYVLEIGCADHSAMADFYEGALGYTLERKADRIVARASDRVLVFVPDQPRALVSAGFALPDRAELEGLMTRLREANWAFEEAPALLFAEAITVRDPDGNTFVFGVTSHDDGAVLPAGFPLAARLQHVVMASRNPSRIVRLFVEVLGFTVSDDVLDDNGGVRTTFLRCSQEHHSFAVFQAAEDRLDHHCYETTDWNAIRDWGDHLARERVRIEWGPGRHGPGNNLFLFIHDPEGNWVELSAELEVVRHDRPVGQWPHEERTLNTWGQGLLRS